MAEENNESSSLMRRFGWVIGLAAVVGVVMAFGAEHPRFEGRDYADAWRETGGAIVAGAVIAAIVVLFEDKRDAERARRDEELASDAAQMAWRAPADRELLVQFGSRLSRARKTTTDSVHRYDPAVTNASQMALRDAADEITALLELLGDSPLLVLWSEWQEAWNLKPNALNENPEEIAAFDAFSNELAAYVRRHYPSPAADA